MSRLIFYRLSFLNHMASFFSFILLFSNLDWHALLEQKHCVSIYPEAHLWPYYTGIRQFPETSFKFPVNENKPSFTITTTYQKRKHRKKPRVTLFVDGPFWPDKTLSKKERAKKLHDEIYNTMVERSKNSTYDYVIYKKADEQ